MKVYHGTVITCNENMDIKKYLVEDKGKIVFTGDYLPLEYHKEELINLGNQALLPSFCDTHLHFSSFALFAATLDIRDIEDYDVLKSRFNAYVKRHKPKIILAFGLSVHSVKEKELVTRQQLDKMGVEVPIMIIKYDGHASVVNSKMLNLLPKRIRSLRGYNGDVGQMFQEAYFAATDFATSKVSVIDLLRNMLQGIDTLAEYGIGLIHTAEGVGFPLDMDISISKLLSKGLMNPFQIRLFFQTMNTKKVHKRKLPRIGGCFETALDGCFGSVDAALMQPYENQNHKGILFYEDAIIEDFVLKAHLEGLQIALHAIGDAAFDQALRAYEKALEIDPRKDHRHTIIHGCLISEESLIKAGNLGIHIATQPSFIHWDLEPLDYVEALLGDRAYRLNPLRSMINAGIKISGGSDAPCTVPNPIEGIYCACNHYNTEESISIEEALKMYTLNGAYAGFDEGQRGSLEVGKYADMIIVNQNPLEMDRSELRLLRVETLFLQGKRYVKGQRLWKLIKKSLIIKRDC